MIRKKILTSAVGVLLLFAPFTAAITANAAVDSASDAKAAVCDGLGAASGGNGCEDPDGSSSLSGTVAAAINLISLVVAVIAVFMVIVGGLKYVTSQGESSSTASAKNTIIYAIVGLLIAGLAQVIVRFVVNRTTS
ncbi:hypothetical protein KC992_00775 [Candidatus Saccharibacteria bacterium]|nr:hypothetical protein [Candidatus Saccharibacteria bacterium]MCA9328593.1 hypothetical protein [Candidatus Saccharibacteria bacterium]